MLRMETGEFKPYSATRSTSDAIAALNRGGSASMKSMIGPVFCPSTAKYRIANATT